MDNDSARAGLIKGAGATRMADAIIECVCTRESDLQLRAWFNRVSSHANPSDGPSRSDFGMVKIGLCHNKCSMLIDPTRGALMPQ